MADIKKALSEIEKEVSSLLQNKDKQAITLIYNHYKTALFGVILKIVKDEAIAEDVLQESLVKMWRYGPNYNPNKGRLFTWLLNICRNTAIDKTRLKSFQVNQKIPNPSETVSMEPSSQIDEEKTDAIGLKEVVEKLDPKYRELLELVYFQGYTQKEIADEFNIPLGTVKTRVRSAIQQLRLWLKK